MKTTREWSKQSKFSYETIKTHRRKLDLGQKYGRYYLLTEDEFNQIEGNISKGKLNIEEVLTLHAGGVGTCEIARRMGVDKSAVSHCIRRNADKEKK